MTDTVENLILDLVEWVGRKERSYYETIDAWRTSCPRLPVWEDATDRGLVETVSANGRSLVRVTAAGLALLKEKRPVYYERFIRRQSVRPDQALQRTGAMRFSFISHWFYKIISFGGRALPTPVADPDVTRSFVASLNERKSSINGQ